MENKRMTMIAESAIKVLRDGINEGNKRKILSAYAAIEHPIFSWDGLDVIFMEWDELVDEANEILLS